MLIVTYWKCKKVVLAQATHMQFLGADPGFDPWQMTIACYDLWSAGVETVTCTLQFAMVYLIRHQDVQNRIREELKIFEQKRLPYTYVNLKSIPYLNAFFQV